MRTISQRVKVFVGCEGRSERAYVRWLQERADQQGLRVHFDSFDTGGGDPLAVVEKSIREALRNERYKGRYRTKFVLLDEDRIGDCPARDQQINSLQAKHGIGLVFQKFDHEALLLRHFPNCENLKPSRGRSLKRLRREWPGYVKPAAFVDLNRLLDHASLERVLTVESRLREQLEKIGFCK